MRSVLSKSFLRAKYRNNSITATKKVTILFFQQYFTVENIAQATFNASGARINLSSGIVI
jgi:hypothetical protein